jgi:hypothetical protein
MKLFTALMATALLFCSFTPTAFAQDETWKKDRFRLGVGLFRPDMKTQIRVDDSATGNSGTLLSLEDDLDLSDRETELILAAHFRIAKRHAIELDHVNIGRSEVSNVGFTIDYDDKEIEVSTDVETTFKTKVTRLGYRFSFLNNEKHELSGAVGLHVTDLKVGLNVVGEESDFNDVTAPLPTLGGAWKYHFNENWAFHIRGEWLDLKIDEYKGSLTSGLAEVEWYPWRNFGFGLGYYIWDLDVSATDNNLTGTVEYEYKGPKLNLNLRF